MRKTFVKWRRVPQGFPEPRRQSLHVLKLFLVRTERLEGLPDV